MSIVHEAVCDGCGKRAEARYPQGGEWIWDAYSHPDGWYLVFQSNGRVAYDQKVKAYCSRECVAKGKDE